MDLLKRSNTKKSDRLPASRKGSIKASDIVPKLGRVKTPSITSNCVGEEEDESTAASAAADTTLYRYGTVVHEYNAQEALEINLEEGTTVAILPQCVTDDKPNSDMLLGISNGVKGIFPASCVKILTEDEAAEEGLGGNEIMAGETKDQSKSGQKRGWFSRYVLVGQSAAESPSVSTNTKESATSRINASASGMNTSHSSPSLLLNTNGSSPNLDTPSAVSPSSTTKRPFRLPGQRMLWSDYMGGPDEVAKLNLTKQELKRQEVIYEIIATEADYIQDLETVLEV